MVGEEETVKYFNNNYDYLTVPTISCWGDCSELWVLYNNNNHLSQVLEIAITRLVFL